MKEGDHNRQRKAAVINDYSSFGRCSLAVSAPILAAMGVQCCPVPTAFFTNHTGFEHFSWVDATDHMEAYLDDWLKTGLRFSAIASGFLASERQIDFVRRFVGAFRDEGTAVVVDPVMGDYGKLYRTFKPAVAERMRSLLDVADVVTPNYTEACILIGRPYSDAPSDAELLDVAKRLCAHRVGKVVISGVSRGRELVNFVYSRDEGEEIISAPKVGPDRSGTGDVFSSVIVGELVRGRPMTVAVRSAVDFVSASVRRAEEMGIPVTDGLPIEETLSRLWSSPIL